MTDEDAAAATAERLRGYVVLAITMGARVAEVQAARARDEARDQTVRLTERRRAEAALIMAQFRDVGNPDWWARATPAEIGTVYATARSLADVDPVAASLAERMRIEIGDRYGVDAEKVAATAGRVQAGAYLAEANLAEGLVVPEELREAVNGWDDPDRRGSLADRVSRYMPNDPDAQHARMAADAMQGEPAAAAPARSVTTARIIKPARTAGHTVER